MKIIFSIVLFIVGCCFIGVTGMITVYLVNIAIGYLFNLHQMLAFLCKEKEKN